MQVDVMARPGASVAKVVLDAGEKLTCQTGAMVAMSTDLTVETSARQRGAKGGFLKAVKRVFAGENFFLNTFTAGKAGEQIYIGPSLVGDVVHHRLSGTMIVQGSSWLGSSEGISVDATWQGFARGIFGGEGLFWVKCQGDGDLILNSFGAIYEVDVDGDYVVDTGHIVAFEDTLQFKIGKAGSSLIGSILGGEGLVCKFNGKGKLYCQSHNPPSFGAKLGPHLKPR